MLTINAEGHDAVMKRMHRPGDEKRSVVILRPGDRDEGLHTSNSDAARAMLKTLAGRRHGGRPRGLIV